MIVYGITMLQMYFYFIHYPKDNLGLKVLVATIWTLDTFHIAFICHSLYATLSEGLGTHELLSMGPGHYLCVSICTSMYQDFVHRWHIKALLAVNVTVAVIVQGFFTLRIYRSSRKKIKRILSSVIGFVVLAHFCFGIETVIYFSTITELSKLNEARLKSALPFEIASVLSNILIASALCFLLESSRTDFEDADNLIAKIIVFAINRCVLTSAMAITEIIVFFAKPQSFYSFGINFIIGKLYANSLLATLNSRKLLGRGTLETSDVVSTSFRIATVVTGHGRASLDEVPISIATQDSIDDYPRRPLDIVNK
ncbi:hypothetical protein BD779DRAFT_1678338 [Infundibulicybe gibba]|nr:hypothetical protein BD779DRAFT_1678338 [Infundibulicybe gibba]